MAHTVKWCLRWTQLRMSIWECLQIHEAWAYVDQQCGELLNSPVHQRSSSAELFGEAIAW